MAGTTVTVGNKTALSIVLRLQVDHVARVNIGGAVHEEKMRILDPSPDAETYTIKGFSRHHARVPDATIVGAHRASDGGTLGGYALSHVPKDFWDKWVAQNKDFEPLKKGFIIAYEKLDTVEGIAKERRDVMSGMEPFSLARPSAEFAGKITQADYDAA